MPNAPEGAVTHTEVAVPSEDRPASRFGLDLPKLQEWWQVVSAGLLATAGLCFASGYLIVSIRLARFGIYAPGFVRAEFVLAGALFLFFGAVSLGSVQYFADHFQAGLDRWRKERRLAGVLKLVVYFFAMLGVPFVLLQALSDYQMGWWDFGASLAALAFLVLTAYTFLLHKWPAARSDIPTTFGLSAFARNAVNFFAVAPLIQVFLALSLYAHSVYPRLSPAFGGGKRAPILLMVSLEGAETAMHLGLPVSLNNKFVGPLDPLTETEDDIVVLVSRGQGHHPKANAIRFPKALCLAIINVQKRE